MTEPAVHPGTTPDATARGRNAPRRVFVQTFGCQMNDRDSERIIGMLEAEGYVQAATPEEADLVLLNTCAIRENPENKVYSQLGRWRHLKDTNPDVILGVGGCVAQQEGAALLRRVPYLDLVFGTHTVPRLPELIRQVQEERTRLEETAFVKYDDPALFAEEQHYRVTGATAMVSIQKGCDKFCSFCVVPHVRGREVSRPPQAILDDVAALADRGVTQVTLLGQNVNAYGRKFPEYGAFAELLAAVADVSGIKRVRFTTSHPNDMTPDLIDVLTTHPRICKHLHLPVQSGSDEILRRMRRGYTVDDYCRIIRELRGRRPEFAVSSDFIVGYPGETDADFQATLDLVGDIGFASSFCFMYSPRPHTKALHETAPRVAPDAARARLQELLARQKDATRAFHESLVGSAVEILVEEGASSSRPQVMGRTGSFVPVHLPSREVTLGDEVRVRVTRAHPHCVEGAWRVH